MSMSGHVDEFRVRLVRAFACFACVMGVLFFWGVPLDWLLNVLKAPLFDALPAHLRHLYFTGLFEAFFVRLKVAAVATLFLLAPYFFWEFWGFFGPALYPQERKWVMPFVFCTTLFFFAGASFAYFVLFPLGFRAFLGYASTGELPLMTMKEYYDTCLNLIVLFGLAFEVPVLITLLGALGVIDALMLRQYRRFAIIGIAAISALIAPPDMLSMALLMVPLIVMYEAAILVVAFLGKKRVESPSSSPLTGQSDYAKR